MTYAQRLNHVRDLFCAARHTMNADERAYIFAAFQEILAEARATTRTAITSSSPELAALAMVAQTEFDALETLIDELASMLAPVPEKRS